MNKKAKKCMKYILGTLTGVLLGLVIFTLLVFYGPFTGLRDLYITTAMTTMNHKYLATWFFSDELIKEVMEKNAPEIPKENSNKKDIIIEKKPVDDKKGISFIKLNQNGYKGYLLIIDDPSKVYVATAKDLGRTGEKLSDIAKRENAIAGINAGGYSDEFGKGMGGEAEGIVISQGSLKYDAKNTEYHVSGFDWDNVLNMGIYRRNEINNLKLRDAVCFKPFLIINGKPLITHGDGGWGIAPRTAIGQTKDGKVLMLAIDGRQLSSIGATLKDVQDLMLSYGAYNAVNLDGGSSTAMYYKEDGSSSHIVNNPCGAAGERLLPTAFLVRE